tara:strand:+ start:316 stop:762 length:447 start_codon:yes stop_codon:yes gene_type:complete
MKAREDKDLRIVVECEICGIEKLINNFLIIIEKQNHFQICNRCWVRNEVDSKYHYYIAHTYKKISQYKCNGKHTESLRIVYLKGFTSFSPNKKFYCFDWTTAYKKAKFFKTKKELYKTFGVSSAKSVISFLNKYNENYKGSHYYIENV